MVKTRVSQKVISLFHVIMINMIVLNEYIVQSLTTGHQSNCIGLSRHIPAIAATPSVLNIREPIIVPTPISLWVMRVLIVLVKNSGIVVAEAMNVAAATSFDKCKSSQMHSTVGRKKSLQTTVNRVKKYIAPKMCNIIAPCASCSSANLDNG